MNHFWFFTISIFTGVLHAAISADNLLKLSDQGRGGMNFGIQWAAEIETIENGEKSVRGFDVKALDRDAYVEAKTPARNKGEVYIFNDRTMWFYKPALKKPVSISARQKLSGQAANGDIASTYYSRDYTPSLEKEETFNGENCVILILKAKTKNLTYDQIRYWISVKSKLAVKAEFLTLQGKPFKIGLLEYKNKLSVGGKTISFVSKLTIYDSKFPENRSTINYSAPRLVSHSTSLFNVNNLTR